MLRDMYKNAGQAIILATMAMPPSTEHKKSLIGLMSMKTMQSQSPDVNPIKHE
jgi:hypothetical protein